MVGKSFNRAVRLAQILIVNWDQISGSFYASTGKDPFTVPHHHLLNIVYVWALDRQPDESRQAWDDGLDLPLPGHSQDDAAFDDSYDQINQQ